MIAAEYQAAKVKLGVSHEKLGKMLGISRRQSQRYASGEKKPIPKCIGICLALIVEGRLRLEE